MPGTIADDEPQARIFRLQLGKLRGLAHSGAALRIWRDHVLQNLEGVSVRLLDEVPHGPQHGHADHPEDRRGG